LVSDNVVAILLGILANSIYNIGLVFKKKGICTLPEIENQSLLQNIKNFAKCKAWLFGVALTVIQWFPLMYAIKIGSLSVVAPTMAVGFAVLILFSWLYLKEPIKITEMIGIVIIIAAIVTLYVVKPIESGRFDLQEMSIRFREVNAIGFLCFFAVAIGLLYGLNYGRKNNYAGPLLAIGSGSAYAIATIFAKGAIGSLEFGQPTFIQNSLASWQWWIYLILMCFGYLTAFTSQQMAIQKGKAIVVSPILDIMNLFTQVTAGIIIFNEWAGIWGELLIWQKVFKIGSIILIIVGVTILSVAKAGQQDLAPKQSGKDDEEEQAQEEITTEETESDVEDHFEEEKPLIQLKEKITSTKIDDSPSIIPRSNK
jgi:uncharacterized membrane protein